MERSTRVSLMLAQWAQVHPNGTLNIMGGGMTVVPYPLPGMFIAGSLQFGWGAIGAEHAIRIDLLDDQAQPVPNADDEPVVITGKFPLAPLPGITWGTTLGVPLVVPVGPLTLAPSSRYEWRVEVDGEWYPDWDLPFSTMQEAQPKAA